MVQLVKFCGIQCPGFVQVSNANDEIMNSYGLTMQDIYTFTAKGWDMKQNGREILKIDGIGWVPSSYLKVVEGIIPN